MSKLPVVKKFVLLALLLLQGYPSEASGSLLKAFFCENFPFIDRLFKFCNTNNEDEPSPTISPTPLPTSPPNILPTSPPSISPTSLPTSPPTSSPSEMPTTSSCRIASDPFTPSGSGNTIYVNSASEISTAMLSSQPGDTLIMTDGTWTDEVIVFRGDGTSASPITLQAETPGLVVLTGSSHLSISGSHLVVDGLKFQGGALALNQQVIQFRTSSSDLATNCRLTNTAIIDYNPASNATEYKWLGLYGTNNRVDHCYFSGKAHKGALMVIWRSTPTQDFHRIDHNYFGDFASGGGENEWETIRIGTSATSLSDSSSTVERNLFLRCSGEIEIISVKSGDNRLVGNTFDSCEGMLTLRHGRGNTVDGNFFFGRGLSNTGGVRIIDSDHLVVNNYMEGLRGSSARAAMVLANGKNNSALNEYFPVERAVVAFNTLYDVKEAFRIGWRSSENAIQVKDSVIANNAVRSFSASATKMINEEDPPTNMVYEGNIMHGVPLGILPTPSGIMVAVDPQLVLSQDGLYRPEASSLCVDGATGSYPEVLFDMDGESRPNNANKDVGADEISVNPLSYCGPLYYTDVGILIGPSWM